MRLIHAALALSASALAACSTAGWRQVAVSPAAFADEPKEVRVTQPDGRRVTLVDPRIAADSVFGTSGGHEVAIPMEEVRRLAVPAASNSRRAAGNFFVVAMLGGCVATLAIIINRIN